VVRKSILEALPIIAGVLISGAAVAWVAWVAFEFLAADAPVVLKIRVP
jgi:hypothetical protein